LINMWWFYKRQELVCWFYKVQELFCWFYNYSWIKLIKIRRW